MQSNGVSVTSAITYVHVTWLDRETFESLRAAYPRAARALKVPVLWDLVRRKTPDLVRKEKAREFKSTDTFKAMGRAVMAFHKLKTEAEPETLQMSRVKSAIDRMSHDQLLEINASVGAALMQASNKGTAIKSLTGYGMGDFEA